MDWLFARMVSIPLRLLEVPFVQVHSRGQQVVILEKSLSQPMLERPSYVSMHALSIVLAGAQRITTTDGPSLQVSSGHIGMLRKGLYNVTDLVPEQGDYHSVHFFFEEEVLGDWLGTSSQQEHKGPFWQQAAPDWLEAFLAGTRAILKQAPELAPLKLRELLTGLMAEPGGEALRAYLHSLRILNPRELLPFMRAHVYHPFSIADYASLTGRSESTFRREFKQKTGCSPRQWIIEQRLTKAQELLHNQQDSVSAVAAQVGYQHVSHFIKAYKKAFGHTPKRG
ncbi:MAG: AraC family transcriptional regulator [Bacteroidota bacterium]